MSGDITASARLTLADIQGAATIARLALRYVHRGDPNSPHIAYARQEGCYYGRGFMKLNRHQKAAVMAHEVLHHILGHIPIGAHLYKRLGPGEFCHLTYNIACDAIINELLSKIDHLRTNNKTSIAIGIQECEEFGVVRWKGIVDDVKEYCDQRQIEINPVFQENITNLTSTEIYIALRELVRQEQRLQKGNSSATQNNNQAQSGTQEDKNQNNSATQKGDQTDGDEKQDREKTPKQDSEKTGKETIIEKLARTMKAHSDLRDAIEEMAKKTIEELQNTIAENETRLKSIIQGAGSNDILKHVQGTLRTTTPWEHVLRRSLRSSLTTGPRYDPQRFSKRSMTQLAMTIAQGNKNPVVMEPRLIFRTAARRLTVIIDTSGSIYCDESLLERFMAETKRIVRTTASTCTVMFADHDIKDEIPIEDLHNRIERAVPKGGGGTSFKPAIARAVKLGSDSIVYLTDLHGDFPEKKPRCPVIWAVPKASQNIRVPFGKKLVIDI